MFNIDYNPFTHTVDESKTREKICEKEHYKGGMLACNNGEPLVFFPDTTGITDFSKDMDTKSMVGNYNDDGVLEINYTKQQSIYDSILNYYRNLDTEFQNEIGAEYQFIKNAKRDDIMNYFFSKRMAINKVFSKSIKKQMLDVLHLILMENTDEYFRLLISPAVSNPMINNDQYHKLIEEVNRLCIYFEDILSDYSRGGNFDLFVTTIQMTYKQQVTAVIADWLYDTYRAFTYAIAGEINSGGVPDDKNLHCSANDTNVMWSYTQSFINKSMQEFIAALDFILSQVVLISFKLDGLRDNLYNNFRNATIDELEN